MASKKESALLLTEHDYNENGLTSYHNGYGLDREINVQTSSMINGDVEMEFEHGASYSPSLSSETGDDCEEIYDTKEVQVEGDVKRVTYRRKVSIRGSKKKKDNRHCHSNNPSTPQDKKSRNKLILASVLCLIFMLVETVGGILAGSLAIISDAAHLLTDFASFMISLVAIYLASRPATKRFNYGWHRAEILGAFASIMMLWILTGVLAYEAVMRLINSNYEIDSKIMLITAAIGVAFNLLLGTTLHQHGHSHGGGGHGHSHGGGGGHGHSHGGKGHSHGGKAGHGHINNSQTNESFRLEESSKTESLISNQNDLKRSPLSGSHSYGAIEPKDALVEIPIDQGCGEELSQVEREKNINVKAAFVHVVGDLLQSVGVLIAAFIIYFKPEWKMADPICTFVFSLIVVVTTVTIMRDIIVVLMEGKPRGIDFSDVRRALLNVDKVKDTHNLRMWSLTMDKMALSVHLVVEDGVDAHEVLKNASMALRKQFKILDITIQIEEYVKEMDDCTGCVEPS